MMAMIPKTNAPIAALADSGSIALGGTSGATTLAIGRAGVSTLSCTSSATPPADNSVDCTGTNVSARTVAVAVGACLSVGEGSGVGVLVAVGRKVRVTVAVGRRVKVSLGLGAGVNVLVGISPACELFGAPNATEAITMVSLLTTVCPRESRYLT